MSQAILLTRDEGVTSANLAEIVELPLGLGELRLGVEYSTINYKDALAITGQAAIVRKWPMVPGIDCVGKVVETRHPDWGIGDEVVITGWGLGETIWGGLAESCRVCGDWALKPPVQFDAADCMAVGTAGVTAALCVMALQEHKAMPKDARILVTGAAGGVGSMAVALLSGLGYEVWASTGRLNEARYLESLGAIKVLPRHELDRSSRPLENERWHGVVDTVGGRSLVTACAGTRWNGAIAACGLAGGVEFPATVMPFILRGVTLYGINSVFVDNARRGNAWDLLAGQISRSKLTAMSTRIELADVIAFAPTVLAGAARGRTIVAIGREAAPNSRPSTASSD